MSGLKIIITGATGFVGEGVLLECLSNPKVEKVLMLNRRHYALQHTKLTELIVADFMQLDTVRDQLKSYDTCFYCAGISSVGMDEKNYTYITYDLTMNLATLLSRLNPGMVFNFISGSHTDDSEKGKVMWARVKGKTENALMKLPFKDVYNFRPGLMKPTPGQKNAKFAFKLFYPLLALLFSKMACRLSDVGRAMINTSLKGYAKHVLEVKDIVECANS